MESRRSIEILYKDRQLSESALLMFNMIDHFLIACQVEDEKKDTATKSRHRVRNRTCIIGLIKGHNNPISHTEYH
ncbi:hypothetical protein KIN20_024692 [Parelaphostrongylus tenuis]|uniref:Uncharacterized protein n=1 Tax=Parelaphostrongylus tenuis TaxID=148309 RepID=A0AAD5QW55_PARTN|nr:hypothetical protein KIN20_024692 [Parelaphostrongylus tenuis]